MTTIVAGVLPSICLLFGVFVSLIPHQAISLLVAFLLVLGFALALSLL